MQPLIASYTDATDYLDNIHQTFTKQSIPNVYDITKKLNVY